MWEATVDHRRLTFHLAGINNQNFIMRDDETGSWWQQVTGEAIFGPLKGRQLKQVTHDELTFATWKGEQPGGRVLRPDERVKARYEAADWEEEYANLPVVVPVNPGDALKPRDLIYGVTAGGASKAYPQSKLKPRNVIVDTLGGVPLLLVVGDDGKSVRVFDRTVDGRALEFFANPDATPLQLVDSETGSQWDFTGKAVAGSLAGRQLKKVPVLADYWFDWKIYHPDTLVY